MNASNAKHCGQQLGSDQHLSPLIEQINVDLTPIVQAPIKDAIKSRNTKAKKTITPTITSLRYF
jgi:hypothetical protein